jgi:predicted nucleic acid-binding protein
VRYWDASALVPLLIAEPATKRVRSWIERDASLTAVPFVCLDERLAAAAEREGLIVLSQ